MVMSLPPDPTGDSTRLTTQPKTDDDGAGDLLETSNSTQSAISNFPSDLLSLIFQYACPVPLFDGRHHDPDTSVLRSLSLVSRHWHRTLMDTSELWTSICLPMKGDDTSSYAAGLASFFEKTSHRSLSLSLDFSGLEGMDDDILLHPSLDATILKNFERIENLQLTRPPLEWFRHLHRLSRTDHLSLHQTLGNVSTLCLDHIPSLSKFTLVNGDLQVPMISSCLITSLTLIGVPVNTCFGILASCPKLTMLHLEGGSTLGREGLNEGVAFKVFEPRRLETLVWKLYIRRILAAPWLAALLEHIDPSSLRNLVWHQPWSSTLVESPEGQRFRLAVYEFFERLSPTLTSLEFVDNSEDVWGNQSLFVQRLDKDQGIESLKFTNCNVPFIMAIFERLTSPARFPKLHTITIGKILWSDPRQHLVDERFGKMLSERFLKMVEGRWGVNEEWRFVLHMEDDSLYREKDGSNCGWLDHIKREMVELRRDRGYKFDILVASKPVDWL